MLGCFLPPSFVECASSMLRYMICGVCVPGRHYYAKAVQANPYHAVAHFNLGLLLHDEDIETAMEHYQVRRQWSCVTRPHTLSGLRACFPVSDAPVFFRGCVYATVGNSTIACCVPPVILRLRRASLRSKNMKAHAPVEGPCVCPQILSWSATVLAAAGP